MTKVPGLIWQVLQWETAAEQLKHSVPASLRYSSSGVQGTQSVSTNAYCWSRVLVHVSQMVPVASILHEVHPGIAVAQSTQSSFSLSR